MTDKTLETSQISLQISNRGQITIEDKRTGIIWQQETPAYPTEIIASTPSSVRLKVVAPGFSFESSISIASEREIDVTLEGSDGPMPEELFWPPAWIPQKGDRAIQPVGEGFSYPVEDESLKILPELFFYCGMIATMAFYGLERPNGCLMTGIAIADEASAKNERINGLLYTRPVWKSSKGTWSYNKSLRYFICDTLPQTAKLYRKWRKSRGEVVTLKDKMKKLPHLERLAGAADIWIWDDNNMNRLYNRPEEPEKTHRSPRKIANEMQALGMKKVLWQSFEGETPEDCAYLKQLGYLVGKYDIYRDVIPKPDLPMIIPYRRNRSVNSKYWPDIISIDEKGNPGQAWALHGLDGKFHIQHAVCEIPALKLTMENVPPDVQRVGYNARFIDVQAGMFLQECYSPLHPATRSDSLRYIQHQIDFLSDIGLVNGVEVGSEATSRHYHYSEGMLSPCDYRAPDAGRRMTTQYTADELPPQTIQYTLNPTLRVPLWDLVYHDCTVNYWYWGDSSNSCPAFMKRRDLINALYGQPPLYSMTATQWEEQKNAIADSYHHATPVAAATAFAQMIGFECLTENRMVQKTSFDNGISVIVNFSDSPYQDETGTIPPETYKMISINA